MQFIEVSADLAFFGVRGVVMFSVSEANEAEAEIAKTGNTRSTGKSWKVQENPGKSKEKPMSFHKIVPVKKHRKAAAPAPKPVAKKAAKKAAPKHRPIAHQG